MSSKVKCTCGWSWNKSDSSKKDMYICHQCGKDNTMKDGGWLNKFQDGGEEEKTYGTYNLPEVVVTPEAEEQGFWKQSIRSYLDENKDAGLLGALSSVVTYPLGLPQQAMMYGLTGKVQRPSEALGIKNGLKALATDIIADPTNLLGVGIADDALKLSSKAGKFLTEETALKNAYKINPFAFKPNESNWYRQVGQSAINDALETGLVREVGEEVSPRMWGEFQNQIKRLEGDETLGHEERMMQQVLASRRPVSPFFGKGELFYPMGRKETITKSGKSSKNSAGRGNADYLIETVLPNESFQPAYVKNMTLGVPDKVGSTAILKPNPLLRDLNNFQLYKQDWLRGYKQIPKKENGGWLNKFDVPEAQNGIEGTMDGLTDKGFSYNGAWGGTMAMGGSLPGATGHFYARYEGGGSMPGDLDFSYPRTKNIPSEGPYAKKTLASAQNGREMQYYQEGLDWNPKTISKNGEWISKFEDGGKKTSILTPEVKYMEEYLNSPMYLERLTKMAGTEKQLQNDSYGKFNAEQFSTSNVTDPLKTVAGKQVQNTKDALNYIKNNVFIADYDLGDRVAGAYDSGVKDIRLRKDLFAENPTVGIHELSHATLQGREPYTTDFRKKYLDPIFLEPGSVGWEPIVQKPTEVKARLDSVRYLAKKKGLYNPEKEKFTEKHLQLLEKDPEIQKDFNFKQLKDQLKKGTKNTGFIWMMNNIAKLQNEESNSLPFAKDGKVITDPNGQWAYPGEITRIPSNQITMQGVDYPVLGISDTGDTQMMYPNQDYTYDGESVTEYPMMQGGGKVSLRSLMNNDDLKAKSDATKVVPKLIKSTTEGEGDNSILKAIRQHLYKTVQPADYADAEGNIRPIVKGILKNKDRFDTEGKEKKYRQLSDELKVADSVDDREKILTLLPQLEELDNKNVGGIDDPYSEAGWKKYLGLTDPKKDTVFTKSNYRPSDSKEKNAIYYSLPKAFEKDLLEVYYTNTNNGKNKLESTAFNEFEFPSVFEEGRTRARVLGNFKIDEGEDDKGKYVSYYDKYDLSPKLPLLGDTSIDFLGKPFEIYNRIYLNNNTGKKENGGWLSKYN
jgi:hypothetical protein